MARVTPAWFLWSFFLKDLKLFIEDAIIQPKNDWQIVLIVLSFMTFDYSIAQARSSHFINQIYIKEVSGFIDKNISIWIWSDQFSYLLNSVDSLAPVK